MGRRMTKDDRGLGKGHKTGPVRTTGAFRNLVFLGKNDKILLGRRVIGGVETR